MDIIIILLLNRRHLSFRYFVVARDRCTSPSCIENTVKRHSLTASDQIQKKAASTFPTNLSCKTTSIVHHQSYLFLHGTGLLSTLFLNSVVLDLASLAVNY